MEQEEKKGLRMCSKKMCLNYETEKQKGKRFHFLYRTFSKKILPFVALPRVATFTKLDSTLEGKNIRKLFFFGQKCTFFGYNTFFLRQMTNGRPKKSE